MSAFGRHLQKVSPAHTTTHLKFFHNLQPLGRNNYRRSTTQDPILKLSPCCKTKEEDQLHFIGCSKNPKRLDALATLLKTITGDAAHPFGITLSIGIEQAATDLTTDNVMEMDHHQLRFHDPINQARHDQSHIGWFDILRGFLATSWHTLVSINMIDSQKPENSRR